MMAEEEMLDLAGDLLCYSNLGYIPLQDKRKVVCAMAAALGMYVSPPIEKL